MFTQVEVSPAPFPAPIAGLVAGAGILPMTSDADYVSPYLRRPLRPLDEVERARKAREARRPTREVEQKENGPECRD